MKFILHTEWGKQKLNHSIPNSCTYFSKAGAEKNNEFTNGLLVPHRFNFGSFKKIKKKITNQMVGNELLKKGTSVLWAHNSFDANLYGPWIWIRVSINLFVSVCFYKIVFFFSFVQLIETTEASSNCIHIYHAFAIKESQQWSKWKFQTGICMDKDMPDYLIWIRKQLLLSN